MRTTYQRAKDELARIEELERGEAREFTDTRSDSGSAWDVDMQKLFEYFGNWRNFYDYFHYPTRRILRGINGKPGRHQVSLYHGTNVGLLRMASQLKCFGYFSDCNLDIDGIGDNPGVTWFSHDGFRGSIQRGETAFEDTLGYAGRAADPVRAIGLYYSLRAGWHAGGLAGKFPPFVDFTRRAMVEIPLPLSATVRYELTRNSVSIRDRVPIEGARYLDETDLPVPRVVKLFPGDDRIAGKLLSLPALDPGSLRKLMSYVSRRWKSLQPEKAAEPWERTLAEKARAAYRIPGSILHPWEHTLRVVKYAAAIAKIICPDHLKAAVTAAYLHDIGRKDDRPGPEHALRGAATASFFLPEDLTEMEKATVLFAIAHHADRAAPGGGYPVTSNYAEISERGLIEGVIAALWDADRLELLRFGNIDEEYLSTSFARNLLFKTLTMRTDLRL